LIILLVQKLGVIVIFAILIYLFYQRKRNYGIKMN
jgi:hypothetical protein